MNAIAPIWLPGVRTRPGLFRPRCVTALGAVILRLEALAQGPEVEGAAFEALGWYVRNFGASRAEGAAGGRRAREAWRVRSPLSLTWIPMPPVTRVTDGAAILVPPGWDHAAGVRRGHGYAWVRRDDSTWFEATSAPPPVALARAALHGWRHILLESLT
jgi:hypothetical protein